MDKYGNKVLWDFIVVIKIVVLFMVCWVIDEVI